MLRQRSPRQRDPAHLDYVRSQPCCHIKGCPRPSEAAHIRMACPARGKLPTGMGEKPSDCWTVPLCGYHHRDAPGVAQHKMAEDEYWKLRGIDPFALAIRLFEESGGAARALMSKPRPHSRKIAPRKPPELRAKIPAGRPLQSRGFEKRERA